MAELTENLPTPQLYSGQGSPGIKRTSGYVTEEFLRELRDQYGLRAYREMGDNDPIVGGLLTLIGGLFRTIDWSAEPRDPEQSEDVEAADFVNEELTELEPSPKELMSEAIDVFQFGFAIAEQIYRRRDDGKIGWREWRFLAPETRDRWIFDNETDECVAFVQRPPSDYRERIIPLVKCIHLRTTRRKGNPEGKSILRNAWRDWYYKVRLEEIEAIGCERDLAGLPVIRIPLQYMDPNAPTEDRAFYEQAKRLVRNVRRDEHEGLVLPSDVDKDSGKPLVDFQLLSSTGTRSIDIGRVIERHDSRIAMSALADFLLLGHQTVGTFSLSSDKTSMFSVVFGGFADAMASELTRQAADRLTKLNGMKGRAKIVHSDFEKEDLTAFTTALEKVTKAGVVIPGDPALEKYTRELMNLPPPDEEWLKEKEEERELMMEQLQNGNDPGATGQGGTGPGGVRNPSKPGGAGRGTGMEAGDPTETGGPARGIPKG